MKDNITLFLTGFLQVLFVTLSTYFISHNRIILAVISGFFISLIWSFNVKKIAFSNLRSRISYAGGASIGTGVGFMLAQYINNL